ncbi:triacylglycerol lipase [Dorcoceras hygrometricum]|uniref:Triacylglycerol lipase n=1 Tax=Dorcoceras hygrometricum TaxID=472368 RepID=A0A2Z7DC68_9LAMI|nr:triacylglycerol lipase [Dorcoceras hygrometricum]
MRSARTETPQNGDRNNSDQHAAAAGGGAWATAGGDVGLWRRGGGRELWWRLGFVMCITDSACKNQLVVVSVQYGPFNPYIPIRSMTIGKSRVARDPITMHTSWRSNSDITSVIRVSMTFRVVRTNQYKQDLGLIHSTNGNHLESPNEGSSIDHQVTIYLHAQNITMFPTNETWYFASQILVSSSGGLILILTAQSTRN